MMEVVRRSAPRVVKGLEAEYEAHFLRNEDKTKRKALRSDPVWASCTWHDSSSRMFDSQTAP